MPMLHILNRSPNMRSSLQSCLRVIQKSDAIILIEDAVIAAKKDNHTEAFINNAMNVFVLEPDLKARGIQADQVIQGIELVDYKGFVKLTVKYNGVQTWS